MDIKEVLEANGLGNPPLTGELVTSEPQSRIVSEVLRDYTPTPKEQLLLVEFDIYLLEALRSSEGGAVYEGENGADRKNEGDFQGFGGVLESLFFELMPQITGFLAVAVLRNRFMLKEPLTVTNLFSGIKELFVRIKDSFKTTANQE